MAWWAWIIVGLLLLGAEGAGMGGFFLMFFGIGGVAVGVLVLLGVAGPDWMQWILFSALSLISMLLFRRQLLAGSAGVHDGGDRDTIVGERGKVLVAMAAQAEGSVEVRGTTWSATNVGERELPEGAACVVRAVRGISLEVE